MARCSTVGARIVPSATTAAVSSYAHRGERVGDRVLWHQLRRCRAAAAGCQKQGADELPLRVPPRRDHVAVGVTAAGGRHGVQRAVQLGGHGAVAPQRSSAHRQINAAMVGADGAEPISVVIRSTSPPGAD